jgi:hypothetical protein
VRLVDTAPQLTTALTVLLSPENQPLPPQLICVVAPPTLSGHCTALQRTKARSGHFLTCMQTGVWPLSRGSVSARHSNERPGWLRCAQRFFFTFLPGTDDLPSTATNHVHVPISDVWLHGLGNGRLMHSRCAPRSLNVSRPTASCGQRIHEAKDSPNQFSEVFLGKTLIFINT